MKEKEGNPIIGELALLSVTVGVGQILGEVLRLGRVLLYERKCVELKLLALN